MIELTSEILSIAQVILRVERPEAGAVSVFVGNVRANSRGRQISHLEYSAYEPMARREMERIALQVLERGPELRCAISHRLGTLQVGEASVVIAVSSPHRAQAIEACAWAIEELKARVPIWKREWTIEGSWWVEDPANPTADLTLKRGSSGEGAL